MYALIIFLIMTILQIIKTNLKDENWKYASAIWGFSVFVFSVYSITFIALFLLLKNNAHGVFKNNKKPFIVYFIIDSIAYGMAIYCYSFIRIKQTDSMSGWDKFLSMLYLICLP